LKKTNFISKTIILFLFSPILVCSAPFKKENPLKGRTHEINLRNLELSNNNIGTFLIGLIELYSLYRHNCDCQYEEKLPNKCIFLYFSLCGCLIDITVVLIIIKMELILFQLYFFGLICYKFYNISC